MPNAADRAKRRHHDTTDRRPDASRHVVADRAEPDCCRQVFQFDLLAYRRLPSWTEQSNTGADQEAERQQNPERQQVGERKRGEQDRRYKCEGEAA